MTQSNQGFSTVKTEGLPLPSKLIARIADFDTKLPRISPEDYNFHKGERINEFTNRPWIRLTSLWTRFKKNLEEHQQEVAAISLSRDRCLLRLIEELG